MREMVYYMISHGWIRERDMKVLRTFFLHIFMGWDAVASLTLAFNAMTLDFIYVVGTFQRNRHATLVALSWHFPVVSVHEQSVNRVHYLMTAERLKREYGNEPL